MSLRLRLATWYSFMLGISLLAFGLILYLMMSQHFGNMIQESLSARAAYIGQGVELKANSPGQAATLVLPALDAFESPEIYAQVRDAQGTVVGSSASLGGWELPLGELEMALAMLGRQVHYSGGLEGRHLHIEVLPVKFEGQVVALVQVATPGHQFDQILARLRLILIAGGVSALVLAGAVGWAMAHRALRPVADITETARAIALSGGFSRRLNYRGSRDEIGLLAMTFNEMLVSLEAAYAAQRRFAADASHELRAPLTVIRGNLELLERVKDMPREEQRQALRNARMEAERLSRLVSDLLSLAQADAGQALPMRAVEVDVVLLEVYRQALAMTSGVEVLTDRLEQVVVQGDKDRLKQMVLILADNALKYTPRGGRVTLSLFQEGNWAVVEVADTGMGIGPKDLPHVFERFYRADPARARDPGGSGLGLPIAKWIVEEHGGEIKVVSVPGQGSVFSAWLPIAEG